MALLNSIKKLFAADSSSGAERKRNKHDTSVEEEASSLGSERASDTADGNTSGADFTLVEETLTPGSFSSLQSEEESGGSAKRIYVDSASSSRGEDGVMNGSKFSLNDGTSAFSELPSRYKLLNILGEGAFSVVYKARDSESGTDVAIKIISKSNMTAKQLSNVRNEVNVLKKAKGHRNVLSLIDSFNSANYCFIVLEYCDGGEIFNKIMEYTYFSEDLSRHVFRQLLSAIDYLHNDVKVAHRDIKPENLIFKKIPHFQRSNEEFQKAKRQSDDDTKVDEGHFVSGIGGGGIGEIKLADFGLAKQLRPEVFSKESNLQTPCGTAGYTAPEVITCNRKSSTQQLKRFASHVSKKNYYSKSVDIWSLGCFLYTILCGFPPFYDDDSDRLTLKILRGEYVFLNPWWDEISSEAKDLISKMLDVNPETRITIEEIWKHPWTKPGSIEQSLEDLKISEGYFNESSKFECQVDPDNDSGAAVEHIEFSDLGKPRDIGRSNSPLLSPRGNAIKQVFNNPAMSKENKSLLNPFTNSTNASVQFIENIQESSSSDDESSSRKPEAKSTHPKTPNPSEDQLSKLNFKDVFNIGGRAGMDDGFDDEYNTEVDDEVAGLMPNVEGKRNSVQKSCVSLDSTTSEVHSDPQTTASSIISGINGDYKFTLNLNDSNLLSRRRSSTVKSSNIPNNTNCTTNEDTLTA